MALQDVPIHIPWFEPWLISAEGQNDVTLDSSDDGIATMFLATRAEPITQVFTRSYSGVGSPTLSYELRDWSPFSATPGSTVHATAPDSGVFSSPYTPAVGEPLCLVARLASGTSLVVMSQGGVQNLAFRSSRQLNGAAWSFLGNGPTMVPAYASWKTASFGGFVAANNQPFNSGTGAGYYVGNRITVPAACRIVGIVAGLTSSLSAGLKLSLFSGTTEVRSVTLGAGGTIPSNAGLLTGLFTPYIAARDEVLILALSNPINTTNARVLFNDYRSNATARAANVYPTANMVTSTDNVPSAWTDATDKIASILPVVDQIDNGLGSIGGCQFNRGVN